MRKLVLMAALLAGCGEVTATAAMDSAAADAGVCAPADQVTGWGRIVSIADDPGNVGKVIQGNQGQPIRCSDLVGLTVGGPEKIPLAFGDNDGFAVQSTTVTVTGGAGAPCSYVWTVALLEQDIAPNLGCKWTVTVGLTR